MRCSRANTTRVAICLPTRGRAEQLAQRMRHLLRQPLPEGVELVLALGVERNDRESKRVAYELERDNRSPITIVTIERPDGETAVQGWNRLYMAVSISCHWFVLGADDIIWQPGWLEAALDVAHKTGAQVIGLNDGGHTDMTKYAAHYMADKSFCEEVLNGNLVPPVYQSWWFDREVCEVARTLGVYAPAWQAVAEHTHPDWGNAERDDTYNLAWPLHDVDRAVYLKRKQAREEMSDAR